MVNVTTPACLAKSISAHFGAHHGTTWLNYCTLPNPLHIMLLSSVRCMWHFYPPKQLHYSRLCSKETAAGTQQKRPPR